MWYNRSMPSSENEEERRGLLRHKRVTEDVEILTVNGFKNIKDLQSDDIVYGITDGVVKEVPIKEIVSEDYNGKIHRYYGRDLEIKVTEDSEIYHKKNNSHVNIYKHSEELIKEKTPMGIPVSIDTEREDYPIEDDLLELLTIIICDGYIKSSKFIRIFKSNRRYGNERIKELLEKYNITYKVTTKLSDFSTALPEEDISKYQGREYICNTYHLHEVKYIVDLLDGTKKKLPDFFLRLSKRQSNLVLNTWGKFDGHVEEAHYDRMRLQIDNLHIGEQLSVLTINAGKRPWVNSKIKKGNKNPTHKLNVHARSIKSMNNREVLDYIGKVWYVHTEEENVMCRCNGYTFIL